jgi:hypothetical protein
MASPFIIFPGSMRGPVPVIPMREAPRLSDLSHVITGPVPVIPVD